MNDHALRRPARREAGPEGRTHGPKRRRRDGRFIASGDLHGRFSAIADVLRAVDPERPERVSTRKFDAARAVAGHGSLPSAKSLADWLRMSWQEVKELALDERRDKSRTYASRTRSDPRPFTSVEGAVLALRRVSQALGHSELAATTYDSFRERASAATRDLLPTSPQIVKLFGDWESALTRAGLAPSSGGRRRTGLPVIEAIGLFVRTQGRVKSQDVV